MATAQQIADLRVMVNETAQTPYTDAALGSRIDLAAGNLPSVAAAIWSEKSARYSELVDVQEGSSRRSLGSLHTQALKMASHYSGLAEAIVNPDGVRAARTRQIERP